MPNLRELLDLVAEQLDVEPERLAVFEREVRLRFGGARVYVQPVDSRKDLARAERARELARRLPTGVVADRLGISASYARRLARQK